MPCQVPPPGKWWCADLHFVPVGCRHILHMEMTFWTKPNWWRHCYHQAVLLRVFFFFKVVVFFSSVTTSSVSWRKSRSSYPGKAAAAITAGLSVMWFSLPSPSRVISPDYSPKQALFFFFLLLLLDKFGRSNGLKESSKATLVSPDFSPKLAFWGKFYSSKWLK